MAASGLWLYIVSCRQGGFGGTPTRRSTAGLPYLPLVRGVEEVCVMRPFSVGVGAGVGELTTE